MIFCIVCIIAAYEGDCSILFNIPFIYKAGFQSGCQNHQWCYACVCIYLTKVYCIYLKGHVYEYPTTHFLEFQTLTQSMIAYEILAERCRDFQWKIALWEWGSYDLFKVLKLSGCWSLGMLLQCAHCNSMPSDQHPLSLSTLNRSYEPHSHNAIFHWKSRHRSAKISYAIIDWVSVWNSKKCVVGYS